MSSISSRVDIKQFTNYDIKDLPSHTRIISIPTKDGMIAQEVEYVTIISDAEIIKLGYCCDLSDIIYPIFLEINGIFKPIFVGKEGMYEIQSEENFETKEDINIIVTGVEVPTNAKFTFEYVISI